VGRVMTDLVRKHHKVGTKEARRRVVELLQRVELPNPKEMADRYSFELSGGQRQRVMIAMALIGRPKLLIADEPTTALDVTVQAGILSLLRRLQQEDALSMLIITHNLGLVAHMTHRIYVMYEGNVVETGDTKSILTRPTHPYTQMLLQSVPRFETRKTRLMTVPAVHAEDRPVQGCRFAPRCPIATTECWETVPELRPVRDGTQRAACFRLEEAQDVATDFRS
jgi:peptide/nickel transport system ATP-binding protein